MDRIEELEQPCISKFVKSDKLFALCSGGDTHPAGQALSSHLRHLVTRIEKLEYGNSGGGLGSVVSSSLPSASSSQLDAVEVAIALIKRDVTDLSHRIGQEVVDLGGEKFESRPQTVLWVRRELVTNAYYLFLDPISPLDLIGSSNLLDNDVADKQYRATRANFVNDRATRLSASFGKELPTLFA